MIRFLVTLALIALLVYVGATVKLGNKTFFGHVRAIWHTEEVQELKQGVKETAGPAVNKLERGVKAGYEAMKSGSSDGSGSGSAALVDAGAK